MNHSTLKDKYERKLNRLKTNIEDYKNSNNTELQIAVSTLVKEKEEVELLIMAINKQISIDVIKNKRFEGLGKCPMCKTELCIDDDDLHYCPTCGQALRVLGVA